MFARRFCVCNAGLKVDAVREILTVIMTSNDENVCSCKRHTVVSCVFCFWRSLCPFLASQYFYIFIFYGIIFLNSMAKNLESFVQSYGS